MVVETKVNIGGVWKTVSQPEVNVGGVWKTVTTVESNVGGTWETVWESAAGPEVSATAASDSNLRVNAPCSCGVRFNTAGSEYTCTNAGAYTEYVGEWLTSGSASDVWVVFTQTGGNHTHFDTKTSGVRYQLNLTQIFELQRGLIGSGSDTISGYFQFYDAAVGGTLLDRAPDSSSSNWEAQVIEY